MRTHSETIRGWLADVHQASRTARPAQYETIYRYHIDRLRDFQHERLIHLLVTLFVGVLTVSAVIALFAIVLTFPDAPTVVPLLVATLATILLVTELFYIVHYYRLENGTQRLYKLTEELQNVLRAS